MGLLKAAAKQQYMSDTMYLMQVWVIYTELVKDAQVQFYKPVPFED